MNPPEIDQLVRKQAPPSRVLPYLNGEANQQESMTEKAYTLWSPSKFIAFVTDPDACFLEGGYIERGEWSAFVGIGGLGKTCLALWLCICLITGRAWCGLKPVGKPGKILFFSSESGIRRYKQDLDKWWPLLSAAERETVDANLRVLALLPGEDGTMNFGDTAVVARLSKTLRDEQPGFVVFDPFADMVDGDENKTPDVVATLRTLSRIHRSASPDAAFMIIHHARTGAANVAQAADLYSAGNFGRGSKALYSRVRCEFQLAPGDRGNPNLLVLACGKANNAEKFKPRGIVFDPESFTYVIDPDFDLDAWRLDVAGKSRNKSASIADVVGIVKQLCPYPGDTVKAGTICAEAIAATGAGKRTINSRIKEAVEAKYLRKMAPIGTYALGSKPLKK